MLHCLVLLAWPPGFQVWLSRLNCLTPEGQCTSHLLELYNTQTAQSALLSLVVQLKPMDFWGSTHTHTHYIYIYIYMYVYVYIYIYVFFFPCSACGIWVPWPRIEPMPPAMEEQNINHGTAREICPNSNLYNMRKKTDILSNLAYHNS